MPTADTDRVARRTRGLLAIAITDAIHDEGLRPMSVLLVNLRAFFRLELPRSPGGLVQQAVDARRGTAMTVGCVGLFGVFVVPFLLPIEIVRGIRVRRHTAEVRRLVSASRAALPAGYRDNAGAGESFRAGLGNADALYAIDWTIWRDGTACFTGTALGVVRGDEHLAHWITVHRGPPPRDALDAAALVTALGALPVVPTRWEWELGDPFEAVERI